MYVYIMVVDFYMRLVVIIIILSYIRSEESKKAAPDSFGILLYVLYYMVQAAQTHSHGH